MNKDLNLLNQIPLTEDTLKNVVATEKNADPKTVEILGWDFGGARPKGENQLSVVHRVKVQSKINGKITETRYVIKSLPKNKACRKIFRSVEFFQNEITFYAEIVPKFTNYLESKGQSQLMLIPRCYASHHDGENDYIVLQDVSCLGFGPFVRQSSLSYAQCKSVVETMARFHAVSFGYKHENKDDFKNMYSKLIETSYREELYKKWYKRFYETIVIRIAKDALEKEYPGSEAVKVFNSYEPIDFYKKNIEFCRDRAHEPTSVISQGDAWAPNFMVRSTEPNKYDVLLLDFQLARCCSPVLDLVFFIYSSTDKNIRDIYYKNILKDYYSEIVKSMRLLGLNAEVIYSWEIFQKEVKEQSVYGLSYAIDSLLFTVLPETKSVDLDTIEKEIDLAELFPLPNIEIPEHRRRVADVIVHAVENKFI